jgi:hypothetical protein
MFVEIEGFLGKWARSNTPENASKKDLACTAERHSLSTSIWGTSRRRWREDLYSVGL